MTQHRCLPDMVIQAGVTHFIGSSGGVFRSCKPFTGGANVRHFGVENAAFPIVTILLGIGSVIIKLQAMAGMLSF
jgi:hypothetical protein